MGIRENKEAVKIDDWVSDIRGSFIGFEDATEETPPDYNEEAFRVVYSKHNDVGNSILGQFMGKIVSVVGGLFYDALGKTWAFEVSENIYPKSAIEGFPNGTTVTGIPREVSTPDKRVVLKNNIAGERPYMDKIGPESDSELVSKKQERINDLEQQIEAMEGKTHELEQQVDRDEDKNGSRSRYGPDHYNGMNPEGMEGEHYG